MKKRHSSQVKKISKERRKELIELRIRIPPHKMQPTSKSKKQQNKYS